MPSVVRLGYLRRIGRRRVHLLESGAGAPLLLLHGLGGLAQEMMVALGSLADGYRLIAPDRPGYGFSDPLPADWMGPWGQAVWLAQLVDRAIGRDTVVVAHSLAAGPALCLALGWPDRVAGLVLVAPFCRPTPEKRMLWLRAATAPVLGTPLRSLVVPWLAPMVGGRRLTAVFAPDPLP